MFNAGSISATMGLDARGFFSQMNAVESVGKLFPSFVQSFLGNPLLGITDIAKSTGTSLVRMMTDFAGAAASAGKAARAAGMDVEWFSGFAEAIGHGNEGLEQAGRLMENFQKSVAEAANGSAEKAQLFKRLGITPGELRLAAGNRNGVNPITEDLRNLGYALATFPDGADGLKVLSRHLGEVAKTAAGVKGSEQLIQKIRAMMDDLKTSDQPITSFRQPLLDLAQMARNLDTSSGAAERLKGLLARTFDGISKANVTQQTLLAEGVFSKAGMESLEAMRKGWQGIVDKMEEARKEGMIVTSAQAAEGQQWEKSVSRFEKTWEGIKRAVGEPLLETLAPMMEDWSKSFMNNAGGVRVWIKDFIREVIRDILTLADALHKIALDFRAIHPVRSGFLKVFDFLEGPTDAGFKSPMRGTDPFGRFADVRRLMDSQDMRKIFMIDSLRNGQWLPWKGNTDNFADSELTKALYRGVNAIPFGGHGPVLPGNNITVNINPTIRSDKADEAVSDLKKTVDQWAKKHQGAIEGIKVGLQAGLIPLGL